MNYIKSAKAIKTDFLVIGSGIAGLYTALKLSHLGNVIIVTKERLEESNTQYAQGGIAAVIDSDDSLQFHLEDTLQAGAGISNRKAVEVLVSEGPARVRDLIRLGTNFDQLDGRLDLTREGAHSKRRILHAQGDATGKEIRESISSIVLKQNNIIIKENTFMIDLTLMKDKPSTVTGALVWDNNLQEYIIFQSSAVVMAAGGCGQLYANTSNPEVTTGDGIAVAFRAGARITDMEFVQFHPTTFYNPEGISFLISESIRGEGGILRNSKEKRFMPAYHKLAELAPRDVVARAIIKEIEQGDKPYVYLDVTHLETNYIKKRFPTIFNTLLYDYNLDITKDLIPVIPAAHYLMGGIKTDLYGCTSLNGLYACGETACTGVHGANRLASNSLLEGLVFGYRIYRVLKSKQNSVKTNVIDVNSGIIDMLKDNKIIINNSILRMSDLMQSKKTEQELKEIRQKLKLKMMKLAGIIRTETELKGLLIWLEEKYNFLINYSIDKNIVNQSYWELINMLTVARLITLAALKRKESRGGHYRLDYNQVKDDWSDIHIIFDTDFPEGRKYVFK